MLGGFWTVSEVFWAPEVPFFITQMWALLATVAKFGPSNDINDQYYSYDPADLNSLSMPIHHSHFFITQVLQESFSQRYKVY